MAHPSRSVGHRPRTSPRRSGPSAAFVVAGVVALTGCGSSSRATPTTARPAVTVPATPAIATTAVTTAPAVAPTATTIAEIAIDAITAESFCAQIAKQRPNDGPTSYGEPTPNKYATTVGSTPPAGQQGQWGCSWDVDANTSISVEAERFDTAEHAAAQFITEYGAKANVTAAQLNASQLYTYQELGTPTLGQQFMYTHAVTVNGNIVAHVEFPTSIAADITPVRLLTIAYDAAATGVVPAG